MFRAGSLTKRLKVTQGISASPKIQLVPSFLTIGKNQTGTTNLTVSNVSEITGWYWVLTSPSTQSLINGVDIYNGNTSISLPYTGVGVSSTAIKVKNKTNDTGNLVLQGTLYSSDDTQLSSQNVNFQLTGDQNPEPTITLTYAGGSVIILHSGSTETVTVSVSTPNATSYEWRVGYGDVLSGIDISPVSGTTNNVTVTLTNNTRDSGHTSVWGQVTAHYADGTSKNSSVFSIGVDFLPPDYHLRIRIDSQPQTSLVFNSSTTMSFHVEDTEGRTIVDNDLSWVLTCTNPGKGGYIVLNPGSNAFSAETNYSDSTQLTNRNVQWGVDKLSFKLSLVKNGTIIDYIEGDSSVDRFINDITLYPQPQLILDTPSPTQGDNGIIELSNVGTTDEGREVKFAANMNWSVSFDVTDTAFYFLSTTSGEAGTSSTDLKTVKFFAAPNTETGSWKHNMLRIYLENNLAQRYVDINVSYVDPYLSVVFPGEVQHLPATVTSNAMSFNLDSNVRDLDVVYDPEPSQWSDRWLSAYTVTSGNNYKLQLDTILENDSGDERPSTSSIKIYLEKTYIIHPYPPTDPRSADTITKTVSSAGSELKVVQSRKTTNIFIVKVHGETVWDSTEGVAVTEFTNVAASGSPVDYLNPLQIQVYVKDASQTVTILGAAYDIVQTSNGYLKKPGSGQGDAWVRLNDDDLPYPDNTQTKQGVLLHLEPNKSYTNTAQTRVYVYEDVQATVLMWTGV